MRFIEIFYADKTRRIINIDHIEYIYSSKNGNYLINITTKSNSISIAYPSEKSMSKAFNRIREQMLDERIEIIRGMEDDENER